jgi:hypothetical protein
VAGLGLRSLAPARELFSDLERRFGVEVLFLVLVAAGDLARLADSKSQLFQWARWFKKAR